MNLTLGRFTHGLRAACAAIVAVTAVLMTTPTASAQFGLGNAYGEAFQQDFVRRDVQLAADILGLDEAQRLIVETLYEDYAAAFEEGRQGVHDELSEISQEINKSGDVKQIMAIVFEPIENWMVTKQEMLEQLMLDVQIQLNERQQQKWPVFERRWYRINQLNKGRLQGESVDLVAILNQVDPRRSVLDQVQNLVDEYEIAFDAALRNRDQHYRGAQPKMMAAIQDRDMGAGEPIVTRQVELRRAVRDVNERFIDLIAAQLPEPQASAFRDEALRKAYPRVYRPSRFERMAEAALGFDDISSETREAIQGLIAAYTSENGEMSKRLIAAIKASQMEDAMNTFQRRVDRSARTQDRGKADQVRFEFRERDKMEQRYIVQLRGLLTPEQYAELPGVAKGDSAGTPLGTAGGAAPIGNRSGGGGRNLEGGR